MNLHISIEIQKGNCETRTALEQFKYIVKGFHICQVLRQWAKRRTCTLSGRKNVVGR